MALALVVGVAGVAAITFSRAAEEPMPLPQIDAELPAPAGTADFSAAEATSEQIIVRYKPSVDLSSLYERLGQFKALERRDLGALRLKVIKVPKASRQQALEALRADPRVEFAEADSIGSIDATTNDPDFPRQSALLSTQTDLLWDKHKGNNVTVAVLDTGIKADHADLSGRLITGYNIIGRNANVADDNGHGTLVTGVIAANSNNSTGIAGICWGCKVMPVKVADAAGKTNSSLVAEGIKYAVDKGAKVINISISGAGGSASLGVAINDAIARGAMVVGAAGNNGNDVLTWPGDTADNLTVGGTLVDDTMANSSTYGQFVDIAAPYVGWTTDFNGAYSNFSGTSHATPVISGIAAVLRSAFPSATPQQIRSALTATAEPCCGGKINGGRANALRAYNQLAGTPAGDTTKPAVSITAPAAEAQVSGSAVPLAATASDASPIVRVDFFSGNTLVASDRSAPYNAVMDTTTYPAGRRVLTVVATDSAGNTTMAKQAFNVVTGSTNPTPPATPPSPPPTPPATPPTPPGSGKRGDLNSDGKVNLSDLSMLLSKWNTTDAKADLNASGRVDLADLSILLSQWNK